MLNNKQAYIHRHLFAERQLDDAYKTHINHILRILRHCEESLVKSMVNSGKKENSIKLYKAKL